MTDTAMRSMRAPTILLVLAGVSPSASQAQGYRLAELITAQIRAFDRAKTVILLPGGIMEQHGPYLPSYSDGYFNERVTSARRGHRASRVGGCRFTGDPARLGWGQRGGRQVPLSRHVRAETLRAVFMGLATEFGEQGFRWIFLIHSHADPAHNRVLDDACEWRWCLNRSQPVKIPTHRPVIARRRTTRCSNWVTDTSCDPHATRYESRRYPSAAAPAASF